LLKVAGRVVPEAEPPVLALGLLAEPVVQVLERVLE
jgi:hypothetical protein